MTIVKLQQLKLNHDNPALLKLGLQTAPFRYFPCLITIWLVLSCKRPLEDADVFKDKRLLDSQ